MASDRSVEIGIKTTADTSGAQQTVTALKEVTVESAAIERQNEKARVDQWGFVNLDEVPKKAKKATQSLEDIAPATKKAGAGMDGMGRLATQAGYQMTDFAVQVQGGQSAITAFSQQFPQLIGAIQSSGMELKTLGSGILSMSVGIGTAISIGAVAAGIGIQMLTTEYGKMTAAQDAAKNSAEANKKMVEGLGEARRRVLNQQREEAIARLYAQQAADLERQANAMKRMAEIRAAEGALAGAVASAAVTSAQNSGGDVAGAKLGQIGVETANQITALEDALAAVNQRVETAENAAITAKMKLSDMGDIFSDQYKEAARVLDAAEIALGEAKADQATAAEKFKIETAKISATTGEALDTLSTETQAEITRQAQEMQQEISAMAPAAFSGAKVGLDQITKLLSDGIIDPTEMAKLSEAMVRIKSSQEGRDKEVVSLLNSMDANMKSFMATVRSMNDTQANIQEQMKGVNSRK
jgi:hypothetical protein